jgi:uncharacterized protein
MIDLFTPTLPDQVMVRVTPKASAQRVKVEYGPDGCMRVRVYVTVPAEKGKANVAVIQALANAWAIAPSRLTIVRGHTARDKVIAICPR